MHIAGRESDYTMYDSADLVPLLRRALLRIRIGWEFIRAKVAARRMTNLRDRGVAVDMIGSVTPHNSVYLPIEISSEYCHALLRVGRLSGGGTALWCWRCEAIVRNLGGGPSSVDEWLHSTGLSS